MTADLTHILIFKTNINTEADKLRIQELVTGLPLVEDLSIDIDDIDRVLRVVSHEMKAQQIINLINNAGYKCQELD